MLGAQKLPLRTPGTPWDFPSTPVAPAPRVNDGRAKADIAAL